MPLKEPKILIIGAGVVGLTTALTLSEKLPNNVQIKVIAKDLPGDDPPLYTSPKAGAHWGSTLDSTDSHQIWKHKIGYNKMKELSKIPETYVKEYDCYFGWIPSIGFPRRKFTEPWYKDFVQGYKYIGSNNDKFPNVYNLFTFKSFTISTTYYLLYLMNELIKRGITVERKTIDELYDSFNTAIPNYKPDLIINCTGIQFNFLQDVKKDEKLKPIRGHTLIIENNLNYQVHFDEDNPKEPGEFLMLFPKVEGGAALGGIYDYDSPEFDHSSHVGFGDRLISKAKKYLPELVTDTKGEIKFVRDNIGFRPGRIGGPRIEVDDQDTRIIHNYGCGSTGYIESWAVAEEVYDIVKKKIHCSKL
ncbi:hypothetical protein CANARDRAFT_202877 [[Candida] arabinofermentans NRRL YB-2248]|uniref:FAD dependent oxidoreductase domain-containing protein n=1 Tax=[Candida] arabinofermentans NRRL YB-2248 TaxID=983967 RepID=A0A1E4SVT5_9ASCO|nr:hypothetical protein CANARDRAFT_202877 [[Candida] arabinofermentans NRRL YB-2248]